MNNRTAITFVVAAVFLTVGITAFVIDNTMTVTPQVPEVEADHYAIGNTTVIAFKSYDHNAYIDAMKQIDGLKNDGFCVTHVTNVADGGLAERFVVFVLERCAK